MLQNKDYLLIVLSSFLIAGFLYGIDIVEALEVALRKSPYKLSSTQANLFYFFTFMPIALLEIPVGMIIDRIRLKKSMTIMLTISMLSQIVIGLML
jgi:fucose permease